MLLSSVLVNLVLFLFYHLPLTESYNIVDKEGGRCGLSAWYEVDKCMPNREIHNYICRSRYTLWDDEYDGYGKWVRRKEKDRKCSVTNSKCLCERAVWDEFDNYHCRCVNAMEHPDFPSIGILKWNEKVDFTLNEYSSWVNDVKTQHEIHRNGNGYYLRKYADYNWKDENLPYEYKFEIYVPIENGKFKQITGKFEDKICRVHIVSNEGGKFDTLWYGKDFHTLRKSIQKNETVSTQVWDRVIKEDMEDTKITWELEYNLARDVAIPIWHRHYFTNWYTEKFEIIERYFSFIDLPKDKVSFEVKDYCKNDIGV